MRGWALFSSSSCYLGGGLPCGKPLGVTFPAFHFVRDSPSFHRTCTRVSTQSNWLQSLPMEGPAWKTGLWAGLFPHVQDARGYVVPLHHFGQQGAGAEAPWGIQPEQRRSTALNKQPQPWAGATREHTVRIPIGRLPPWFHLSAFVRRWQSSQTQGNLPSRAHFAAWGF